MTRPLVVVGPHGRIEVSGDALDAIVAGALDGVDGLVSARGRKSVTVAAEPGRVDVEAHVTVGAGLVLPEVAERRSARSPTRCGRPSARAAASTSWSRSVEPVTAPLSRRKARRQALFLLYQWDLTGRPLASLFDGEPDAFALELAEAVAAHVEELDARITEASVDWTADRLGTLERNILRIGVLRARGGDGAGRGGDQRGRRAREALRDGRGRRGSSTASSARINREAGVVTASNESLQRAEELLERLRGARRRPRALADADGDVDAAVDDPHGDRRDRQGDRGRDPARARASADAGA